MRRVLAVLMALAALVLLPSPALAQPAILAVTPSTGPTSGGTLVTIQGSGFAAGASVVFGGTFSPQVTVSSSALILATSPAGSAGNVSLFVINPDGAATTTPTTFTYTAPTTSSTGGVTITGLDPVLGSAGTTTVYISGTGFLPNPVVTIGGVNVATVGFVSSNLVAAVVPTGTSLAIVTVTNTNGTSASYSGGVSTSPGIQPVVSSVTPLTGSPAGGTPVTINGAGFVAGATVTFGGHPATSVAVLSPTMITAVTPANVAGPVTVLVSNPAGSVGGLNSSFTYTLTAPVLSSMVPNTGPTGGGTSVTLTGSGFVAGATVTFGGLAAGNVTLVSANQIVATAPPGTVGPTVVLVTNPGGLISGLASGFTYVAGAAVPPTPPPSAGTGIAVTSVSPSSGPVGSATLVTITGQGFLAGAIVTMGGLPATNVTVISSTQILASAPTGATAGSALVVVSNVGSAGAALPNGFTFTSAGTPTPPAPPPTGGTLPPGSSGLMVFGGGSNAALVTASGCSANRVVLWATNAQGQWVGYIPTAPAIINLSWDALFPNGIAAGTPVYVRCS